MTERPSLGYSDMSKRGFATTPGEKLRRVACILAGRVVLAAVFYYLTRAVQMSTAHATRMAPLFIRINKGKKRPPRSVRERRGQLWSLRPCVSGAEAAGVGRFRFDQVLE